MGIFDTTTKAPFLAITDAAKGFSQTRKRRHELWAATCYFRPAALDGLIDQLLEHIKLTDVYVVYNFAEDLRYPDLQSQIKRLVARKKKKGVNVEFRRVKAENGLFHSKGYALLQRDGDKDSPRENYVLITSANLTEQGLGIEGGVINFELSYETTTKKDANAFTDVIETVWEDLHYQDAGKVAGSSSEYDFMVELLLNGTYLCKWDGSLRQELSAVFKVAAESKSLVSSTNPQLSRLGFNLETDSLRRYYFEERPSRPFPKLFLKNYTAKTLIGNWCPSSIWGLVEEEWSDEFDRFDSWLGAQTSPDRMKQIRAECGSHVKALEAIGIKIVEDPMESLERRISNLLRNSVKKRRLYWQYEHFPLPYSLEDIVGLSELFESLVETSESKNWKNIVVNKLRAALKGRDIGALALSAQERRRVLRELRNTATAGSSDFIQDDEIE